MTNVFLISDTHFGHVGATKWMDSDGVKIRPWDSIEEMDAALIENWNSVVKQEDKVYHLGDVSMTHRPLELLSQLNGKKILIKGNHDTQKLKYYTPHFYDIRGAYELAGMLLTHVPVHDSQKYRYEANVHGHLHNNKIDDPWYINVSVEQINYTPISLEEIISRKI